MEIKDDAIWINRTCPYNCPGNMTKPDRAEVERLIDELIDAACAYQREGVIDTNPRLNQARAAIMAKIGGE